MTDPARIRADFTVPVTVDTGALSWVASPAAGVHRKMLDRVGDEVARATSLVRYAAGSRFDAHQHAKGEEFIVLEGVFSDESGDFPAGTYVRNPPGSAHAPSSAEGCVIFVKLRQFEDDDLDRVVVDLNRVDLAPAPDRPGVSVAPLHEHGPEVVTLERWAPEAVGVVGEVPGGGELLVLDGTVWADGKAHGVGTWSRWPGEASPTLAAGPDGARVWIKRGAVNQR